MHYKCLFLLLTDTKDPRLRKLENSFLLGPVLVYARFFYLLTLSMFNVDDTAILLEMPLQEIGWFSLMLLSFMHSSCKFDIAFSH